MLQADLMESNSETRNLSADNYTVYRTIMRIFYLEHQKMHYQMDRDTVLVLLRGQTVFADYTPEQLTLDLQQLVKWKNLTPIQDPRKPRTIAEFKNKQYQYMMSQTAIEIERLTITLENLSTRTAGLSALVFGAQQVRHFTFDHIRESERIDQSPYDEPPKDYPLQPRTRSYKPRMDRSGFADKSAEKAAQRQKILEEERALRQEVMGYIRDGKLDLAALDAPVSPAVRTVFLSWVALANLSPDKRGQTQYGQSYRLKKRGDQTCQLRCTDGILTMPSCVLIFEEAGHV